MKCRDLMAESILASSKNRAELSNHQASIAERMTRVRCFVCRVEDGIQNILKQMSDGRQKMKDVLGVSPAFRVKKCSYLMKWIASCTSDECTLHAHCFVLKSDNVIFCFPEFQGLRCFDIAHHPSTAGLLTCNLNHKIFLYQAKTGVRNDKGNDRE